VVFFRHFDVGRVESEAKSEAEGRGWLEVL